MRLSRRLFLLFSGGALLSGGGGLAMARQGARRLVTTFKEIRGLGMGGRIRVLHLSDLHASPEVPWDLISEAVEEGLSHDPDVVFLTGDFVTGANFDFGDYPERLAALKGHPRCFACLGNHDLPYRSFDGTVPVARRLEMTLAEVGVKLLYNEVVVTELVGRRVKIAGLGDLWCGEVEPERCLRRVNGGEDGDDLPVLLLAHNPDTKVLLDGYRWDVMFSGHTHGGQLVVPLLGWRPFLPVEDRSMAEGIHAWRGRRIHITRGVGNLHGMRINCPPEVSLVDLW